MYQLIKEVDNLTANEMYFIEKKKKILGIPIYWSRNYLPQYRCWRYINEPKAKRMLQILTEKNLFNNTAITQYKTNY